jgi:hypothetical protein
LKQLMKMFSLMLIVLAMTSVFATAQTQTYGCGGVNCVQGRMEAGFPLDTQSSLLAALPNGSRVILGYKNEDLTLSTGGTTTDTTDTLFIPANSFLLGVTGVVTTTITGTCSGWALGDPTTAARFAASNTTLTQGTTSNGAVMQTTGVASATTGMVQGASGAKLRITCATGAASAGKVRVSLVYIQITPPMI